MLIHRMSYCPFAQPPSWTPLIMSENCLFTAVLHIWMPYLHLQTKDVPCHGDRDPHNMEYIDQYFFYRQYMKINATLAVNTVLLI